MAISLELQAFQGPRLLTQALAAPVVEAVPASSPQVSWRIPGIVGGGILGGVAGTIASQFACRSGRCGPVIVFSGASAALFGALAGGVAGARADDGSEVARVGIVGVCAVDLGVGALGLLALLLSSGGE